MDRKLRLLAPLLAALLLAAGSAHAASPAAGPAGAASASAAPKEFEVIEEVEEEDPAEECAEARAEFAHGEIEEGELEAFCQGVDARGGGASNSSRAGKCPLRSAHAHAATRHNMLKVTLGYTTYGPFKARLQLSHRLGTVERHLSRSGTLRFTKRLGHKQPRRIALKLRPVGRVGCPSRRLVVVQR